ncbi:MAG: YbbR-like domain-containing protein [Muribaculaceae bacterium]|nr:YbbR-like domain-containing protein [Muribaculaceae bacterium]
MSRLTDKLKRLLNRRMEPSKTRSLLLYLSFVVVAAIFWCFQTANNFIPIEYSIAVEITGRPENVRFLSQVPDTITVNVQDKGGAIMKRLFGRQPRIVLRFDDYSDGNGQFKVDASQLKRLAARFFSRIATIKSILPEAINARYTDLPGKLVPVELDIDIEPAMLYTQNGAVVKSQDSVLVYSDSNTLSKITEVYTYRVQLKDLTDTMHRKVTIAPIKGAVVEPRSIEVMIPIEKMVTKTQLIDISVRNAPKDVNVIVFPSKVQAFYRTTMSGYKMHNTEFTAVVDYNSIDLSTDKVPVVVGEVPGSYQDVHLALDSVEYIIEKY